MNQKIFAPISVGELIDKITILRIKSRRISDADKLKHVLFELNELIKCAEENDLENLVNSDFCAALEEINEALWDICDQRRKFEMLSQFDDEFIRYSRDEYKVNDRRAEIKAEINRMASSVIIEVKSY